MVQQLREALPWDSSPRYLMSDRDRIFGNKFVDQAHHGDQTSALPTAIPCRANVEGLIGSIRPECVDHMIVFGALLAPSPHSLSSLLPQPAYSSIARQDAPESRRTQDSDKGKVVEFLELGGRAQNCGSTAATSARSGPFRVPKELTSK